MTNLTLRIYSFIYEKFLLAQGSALVLCTKFNVQIGAGRHISHHANTKGFGLTSLSGVHHGFMPLQLKTKRKQIHFEKDKFGNIEAIRFL